ncbi:MAG: 50S ribosomal protein L2 [Verrucomicrobia bacterium]|nr:50S ribosomal protein L2 [Verrucomicrobiota bacterium]
MALKTYRPLTPSQRFKQTPSFSEITKDYPEKSLVEPRKRTGGRNNHGRLTSRHIGGGHKRKYRIIDFKRKLRGVEATVVAIEYDPNRSARIALLNYTSGEKAYILAPNGLEVGAKVIAGDNVPPELGNALPLKSIPLGAAIHNVELTPGHGGQIARSAGQQAILNNREGGYALVRLPSGEIRRIHENAYATIGQVGNTDHMNVSSGKAGRTRWLGRRPHVRGMVMNPVDHPMGGGQGKSKGGGGRHHPVSPWGQLAKGFKTRRKHKPSDAFIVERRKSKSKKK